MKIRLGLFALLIAVLGACSEKEPDLHLDLGSTQGLQPGSAVVLDGQVVGTVTAVKPDKNGGEVAKLAIRPPFRTSFTRNTRFRVALDPGTADGRRVEVSQGMGTNASFLAEDDRVEAERPPETLFPLGEMIRNLAQGLGQLRDQVERFRTELQRLPQSPEAKQLKDEWLRLQDEMKKAQAVTEESVKKELLPRLQQEAENLDKRFKELQSKSPPPGQ